MKFLIITGMSGAGKSRAADVLEDLDYYCVDNMPAPLLPKLAEFCLGMGGRYEKVALVTDIRDGGGADAVFAALDKLVDLGCRYEILFLEADKPTIVKRQKESRRPHPLQAEAGSLGAAIDLEIERLAPLREKADHILDTSDLTLGMLQAELYRIFSDSPEGRTLQVTVMSFGFKFGLPLEADMVLDARFLPNPFYVQELRSLTGMDDAVYNYVFGSDVSNEFLLWITGLIEFLIPKYIEEGKHIFTVAIGCTGGRHRSVAVARAVAERIRALGCETELINRDLKRESGREQER